MRELVFPSALPNASELFSSQTGYKQAWQTLKFINWYIEIIMNLYYTYMYIYYFYHNDTLHE